MPGSEGVVFDTNAFIAWAMEDAALAAVAVRFRRPFVTLVNTGELVFGALKSAHPDRNRRDLETRLQAFSVLVPDRQIRRQLLSGMSRPASQGAADHRQ